MEQFALAQIALARELFESGDRTAAILCWHNVASSYGVVNDTAKQNAINRMIMDMFVRPALKSEVTQNPETAFVYQKIFFGLLENDAEFAKDVSATQWEAAVDALEAGTYPDFPGRAVRLARTQTAQGRVADAVNLLMRAVAATFGKEDQRADAQALLDELINPS
jgi:hypothetical protein